MDAMGPIYDSANGLETINRNTFNQGMSKVSKDNKTFL
jgi:hypothetical protein